MATISHKKNFIVSLSNQEGLSFIDHDQKANLLWDSFRNRLYISEFANISFNLSTLLTSYNFQHLDVDFTEE